MFVAPALRIGKSFTFVAGADTLTGTSYGFDDGATGLGTYGTPSDALPLNWRGAVLQGLGDFSNGSGNNSLNFYARLAGVPMEQTWPNLAALNTDQFFTRLVIRTMAGAVVTSLKRSDGTFGPGPGWAAFSWPTGGHLLAVGTTYRLELG